MLNWIFRNSDQIQVQSIGSNIKIKWASLCAWKTMHSLHETIYCLLSISMYGIHISLRIQSKKYMYFNALYSRHHHLYYTKIRGWWWGWHWYSFHEVWLVWNLWRLMNIKRFTWEKHICCNIQYSTCSSSQLTVQGDTT